MLVKEFYRFRRKYLPKKHDCTEKYNKERLNTVLDFLKFCEKKNITNIKDLRERHYTEYIKNLNLSPATILKKRSF